MGKKRNRRTRVQHVITKPHEGLGVSQIILSILDNLNEVGHPVKLPFIALTTC